MPMRASATDAVIVLYNHPIKRDSMIYISALFTPNIAQKKVYRKIHFLILIT